jgi:hemolysin activation/secretion protein
MTTNITFSPWKNLLPFQSTTAYNQLRNGSHVRYGYLRLSASHRYQLPSKCVLVGLLRGQGATGALPTSEQFGLGGADTVRGYYEQQFVADNAVLLNLEFYSPPLSLFKGKKNELTFLAFFDYGWGYNYEFSAPEFETQSLYGIGPGLRYDILPNFSLRLDYGFQLRGVPGDHRIGRLNFSINVSN